MMRFIFVILALFVCSTQIALCQQYKLLQTELYGMQLYGGFLSTSYTADFTDFSGTVSCDKFTSGLGNGLTAGFQFELPVSNAISVVGGLGFHDRSGALQTNSSFPIRYTSSSNGFTQVVMEQSIATSIKFLESQFDARYIVLERYSYAIRVLGGIRIGFPINGSFTQQATIISPDNAGFIVNNQVVQQRTLSSGDITSFAGLQAGGVVGLEPMIRISPSMHLTGSIQYDIPFSSAFNDANLNIAGLRAQCGIRYSIRTFAPSPITP
ncbi:MAG: hypothetical protein ACKO5I_02775 [Ignavibacteria bacterium]